MDTCNSKDAEERKRLQVHTEKNSQLGTDETASTATGNKNNIIGAVSALIAAVTITLASSAVQGLQQRWPDMELNIFRWTFMIIPLGIYFIWTKTPPSIPRDKIPYVLFYGMLVSAEQVIFFTAVNFLPLGLMAALFRISLVTMAALASRLIEKEPFTIIRALAVTIGIVGILLMTQPEFIFGANNNSSVDIESPLVNGTSVLELQKNYTNSFNGTLELEIPTEESKSIIPTHRLSKSIRTYIGLGLTVFAAFLGVLQGVCMKRRRLVNYCVWKISFWVGVMGIIWTTILSFSLEKVVFITTAYDLGLVACYAVLASAHSFSFLFALKRTSYLIVAIIMVTQIVFNLIAQYTVLKHIFPGHKNYIEVIGAVAVLIAAALPTVTEIIATNELCAFKSKNRKNQQDDKKSANQEELKEMF